MAKINLTPKKIYEQEFKTSMRGYDKKEVDEFLDDVIKDYGVYIALVKELQARQVSHHVRMPMLLRLQTMIS